MIEPLNIITPETVIKEFTVREVFEALAKNGFHHARATFFEDTFNSACVLGQAALNLGVVVSESFYESDVSYPVSNKDIEKWGKYNVVTQLDRFKVKNSKWIPEPSEDDDSPRTCGETIMFWNDETDVDGEYLLSTYEEVVSMAREVLAPHMEKKVKLATYDYRYKV